MKIIKSSEYQEYQDLKNWAKKEKVWKSAQDTTELEDDIDLPIKYCVGAATLLGWQPSFSCCGFDYQGQPYHKYHQYDRPYLTLAMNPITKPLVEGDFRYRGWVAKALSMNRIALEFITDMNPSWRTRDCIHSAEECAIECADLKMFFMAQEPNFQDKMTLHDTNSNYKPNGVSFWQYPPKTPWVVTKDGLLKIS